MTEGKPTEKPELNTAQWLIITAANSHQPISDDGDRRFIPIEIELADGAVRDINSLDDVKKLLGEDWAEVPFAADSEVDEDQVDPDDPDPDDASNGDYEYDDDDDDLPF